MCVLRRAAVFVYPREFLSEWPRTLPELLASLESRCVWCGVCGGVCVMCVRGVSHIIPPHFFQGLFRISCEDILRILRRGRETLLTLLEAFVYDPLIDWTQSEDAAFPLAVRTTKDTTGRQTRKEMEREVASGMLATRLAESFTYWNRNRCINIVLLSACLYSVFF